MSNARLFRSTDVGLLRPQYRHVMLSLRSGLWCVGVSSVLVLAGGGVASAAVSTGPEQTAQLLRSGLPRVWLTPDL